MSHPWPGHEYPCEICGYEGVDCMCYETCSECGQDCPEDDKYGKDVICMSCARALK